MNYFHSLELYLLKILRGPLFRRSLASTKDNYTTLYITFCYPETSPTCNTGQHQERTKSRLSSKKQQTDVLTLTLPAQEVLWFSNRSLLSFLSTIQQVWLWLLFSQRTENITFERQGKFYKEVWWEQTDIKRDTADSKVISKSTPKTRYDSEK